MPSLDGLRAISIVLVLIGHAGGTGGLPNIDLGIGNYAHLGVNVFFVISGFLITSLLMSERAATGRVSLRLFYLRRTLRIFPASYAYLLVLTVLCAVGILSIPRASLVCAFTYTMNYLPRHAWQVGHLWSLSVEEQFYLIWPFAFSRLHRRRAVMLAVAVMAIAVVSRGGARLFLAGTPYRDAPMFPMVADSLAAGCILALTRNWLEQQLWYIRLFQPLPSAALLMVVLIANRYSGYTIVSVVGTCAVNLAIAFLIHRCVYFSKGFVGIILNSSPLSYVGQLSYSLYIWQQVFLNRSSSAWINAFPQNILLAAAAALASYYAIEKPILALRTKLRPSSGFTDARSLSTGLKPLMPEVPGQPPSDAHGKPAAGLSPQYVSLVSTADQDGE